jgi:predicted MFS family arabinose efflux permease
MLKRAFHPGGRRAPLLVAAGCLLIASTYGLARFGVGLLHPAMAAERPGLRGALPAAGAAQFASYCLAAGVALVLAPRRPRVVAGAAGAVATLGCLGLAVSTDSGWFVASAFVGGAGAGLASPALVVLLDRAVPERWSGTAQAIGNAGTSVGVLLGGGVALVAGSPSVTWPAAAAACACSAAGVVVLGRPGRPLPPIPAPGGLARRLLAGPTLAAVGAGGCSAAVWTHGPTAVLAGGALAADRVGLLWVALGVGGLAGAAVDRPFARWGPGRTFAACTALLVLASGAVLLPGATAATALLGAGCFGAAYMALSGTLILWGRRLDPRRGGPLTAWLFVALAIGQAIGSLAWAPFLG